MFCYFQFLIKDPKIRLGAHGNTGAIQGHPFIESIDWTAVEEKCMEPPPPSWMEEVQVSGKGFVFISCHKLKLKLHVLRGSNSLAGSTIVWYNES
jgi:hypothetical protein